MEGVKDYFLEAIESYILDLDRKEITKDSYKRTLLRFSAYLKSRNLLIPKSRNIIEYKEHLSQSVGASSIQKAVVVLRGFFVYLAKNEIYPNIMVGIRGMKISKVMKRNTLSIEQLESIVAIAKRKSAETMEGCRDYAILMLVATTGLRTIEVSRANVSDLSEIGDSKILYIQGKGKDDRNEYVKVSPEVYRLIEDYLKRRSDSYEPLFVTCGRNSYGNRIQTRTIRGFVKELLYEAGIYDQNVSAHSLRHFVCSQILRNRGTLEEAQQVLRHKDISTTQIYNHSLSRIDNDSELKVSDSVFHYGGKKDGD